MKTKMKIDLKKVILVCLVFAALDAMWTLLTSYLPIYLQAGNAAFDAGDGVLGFGFTPALTGLILSLGNAIIMILRPLSGVLSDTSKSKMGRRMPFMVFGMPFLVIALIALSYIPELIPPQLNGSTNQLAAYLIPFFVALAVIFIAYPVMLQPSRVLIFDVVSSEQRVNANSVSQVLNGFASMVVILGGAALYNIYRPLPTWVAAAVILVAVLIVWKTVKEPSVADPNSSEKSASIKEIFHVLRTLPGEDKKCVGFFTLSAFFHTFGLAVATSFLTSYAVSVISVSMSTASTLMVVVGVSCLLAAVPAGMIANRFGRKKSMLGGSVICALSCLLIWIIPSLGVLYAIMVTFSIGFILIVVSSTPMAADLSPSEKYVGTYISLVSLVGGFGPVVGPLVGGWLVGMFNNNYSVIWPLLISVFSLTFVTLIPVTKGEAKTEEVSVEQSSSLISAS